MSETVKRGGCGQCPYDETTCYEMKKTGGICAYDGLFVEITFDECKYRKFPTNGDRIRNMTDEELAEFLFRFDECDTTVGCGYSVGDSLCDAPGGGDICGECTHCILEWLKQEAEE